MIKIEELHNVEINGYKVICISSCKSQGSRKVQVNRGEIFDNKDFYFPQLFLRSNGKFLGVYDRSNFIKLDEYRNTTIDNLLD